MEKKAVEGFERHAEHSFALGAKGIVRLSRFWSDGMM